MKQETNRVGGILFFLFLTAVVFQAPSLFSEEQKEKTVVPPPLAPAESLQVLPEKERNAMLVIEQSRKKVQQLMSERNQLIQNHAPQEEIQNKTKELMETQRAAIQLIQTMMPPRPIGPPIPPPTAVLSPALKQEMESLMEKRKKMVESGATRKDIQQITAQIQQIYTSGMKPPLPPPELPKAPPIPSPPQKAPDKQN